MDQIDKDIFNAKTAKTAKYCCLKHLFPHWGKIQRNARKVVLQAKLWGSHGRASKNLAGQIAFAFFDGFGQYRQFGNYSFSRISRLSRLAFNNEKK
ncbi:MAG: hypothetical protein KBT28_11615 [Bacteroidales bacterium]|nr:hypothetical protein [Candidatus Colimorpha merdihippi]